MSWIVDKNKREIYLFDRGSKVLRYQLDSLINNNEYQPENIASWNSKLEDAFWVQLYTDSLFIICDTDDYLYSVIDMEGNIINSFGDRIEEKKPSYDRFEYGEAYRGFFKVNKEKNKIAFGYRYYDILTIYDINGNELHKTQGPNMINPEFKWNENGWKENTYEIRTFFDIKFLGDFIYCVVNNKKIVRNNNKLEIPYSNSIYVYDWEANPIAEIVFEQEITESLFDTLNNRIIINTPNNEQELSYCQFDFDILKKEKKIY